LTRSARDLSAAAELLVRYKLLCHCMVNPPGGPGGPTAVFTGVLFSYPIRMYEYTFRFGSCAKVRGLSCGGVSTRVSVVSRRCKRKLPARVVCESQ